MSDKGGVERLLPAPSCTSRRPRDGSCPNGTRPAKHTRLCRMGADRVLLPIEGRIPELRWALSHARPSGEREPAGALERSSALTAFASSDAITASSSYARATSSMSCACRHRAQSRYRLVKALPELLGATSTGTRAQLIRRLAVGLAGRRPLKARRIGRATDLGRLARALSKRRQAVGEVLIRGRLLVRLNSAGPAGNALLELGEYLLISIAALSLLI